MAVSLTVKVLEAHLNHLAESVHPVYRVTVGTQRYNGQSAKVGGKKAEWKDSDSVNVEFTGEPSLIVELRDPKVQDDSVTIGVCEVALNHIDSQRKTNQLYNVFHEKEQVGQLRVELNLGEKGSDVKVDEAERHQEQGHPDKHEEDLPELSKKEQELKAKEYTGKEHKDKVQHDLKDVDQQ